MIQYSGRRGVFYSNDLYFSEAYKSLPKSARNLFHCMHNELHFQRKSNKTIYTDNGEISLTEKDFKERFKCSSQTYINARNKLIEVGLIKQTYRGGMSRGDCAQYKLLACDNKVPISEQRWRHYPEKNWEKDIPKAKQQTVGQKTRWKPGESGRKVKSHPKKLGT